MQQKEQKALGFQIKMVNNLIRRKIDAMFSEDNSLEITGMQGPMISYLYDEGKKRDIFQKDLEKKFNIRRSTATVMLQNLEQKGFIVRKSVEYDARLKKIVLTSKAIEQDQLVRGRIDAFHEELEKGLTKEEKEEFCRILNKIKKNLE